MALGRIRINEAAPELQDSARSIEREDKREMEEIVTFTTFSACWADSIGYGPREAAQFPKMPQSSRLDQGFLSKAYETTNNQQQGS
ncbi:hypothetical protein RND71_008334 [Anisodus tanguticus]|uniref:Uncharacterized protein n=1 Tax=Anisodus tanguticus TaxID=243964 RepID=A0AAE1SNJ3_9SOLA|nr:hypothetical protein RND71_008334 [Anisodus tanguticus]